MVTTIKNFMMVGILAVVVLAITMDSTVVGTHLYLKEQQANHTSATEISTFSKAIIYICQPTYYKKACEKNLSNNRGNTSDPIELVKLALEVAIKEIKSATEKTIALEEQTVDKKISDLLMTCVKLFNFSHIDLTRSMQRMKQLKITNLDETANELNMWITGSLTHQTTCLDMFEDMIDDWGEKMKQILKTPRELTINGLNIVTKISSIFNILQVQGVFQKPLLVRAEMSPNEFSSWITADQRRLLGPTSTNIKSNLIIAKDGSGNYRTINEALKVIPMRSKKRFVVHIREGVYNEQVIIPLGMNNVMFIGDGPTKTKITGSLNQLEGQDITKSATFAVEGAAFIAKDMGFENTAGPLRKQALALRIQSPWSIIYNCQIDGYQDTLWAVAYEQFYRDCTISGSVDFIFGKAVAVFQNCKIIVRMSTDKKQNQHVILAGGREFSYEKSALVLQNCVISATSEFLAKWRSGNIEAYLARPWKPLSRIIIMQSHIDKFIHPKGWLSWDHGNNENTCFFAEYGNRGPGSVLTYREKWPGIKKITSQQALYFTPTILIQADKWVKSTGIPYYGSA